MKHEIEAENQEQHWQDLCLEPQEGRYKATWEREFKLPWRKAGPPNHLDDIVNSDL